MNRTPSQPHQCSSHSGSTPRYSSLHSNSSAFSANAGPNEDWTKISDLAERRRIQNRIAQRNYRKKLKRRLEDLERRAASSSASPEPSSRGASMYESHSSDSQPRLRANTLAVPPSAQRQRSPPATFQQSRSMSSYDEESLFQYSSARHHSPMPAFSQSAFSSEEAIFAPSYTLSPAYTSATSRAELPVYSNYLFQQPETISSLHSSEGAPVKREPFEEDLHFPTPEFMPAEVSRSGLYRESNPNIYTPSLSDSLESLESYPSSIMGPPADLWALYPTPPGSVDEDENSLFGLNFTSYEKPDLFTGVGSNFESSFDEDLVLTL